MQYHIKLHVQYTALVRMLRWHNLRHLSRAQKALTIATAGHVTQTSRCATFTTTRCADPSSHLKLLPKDLVYRVIWGIICRPMMLSRVILGTTPGRTHHLEHG